MIFPHLFFESIVQVSDRIRLSACKTFSNQGDITNIEIEPHTGDGFFSVMSANEDNRYLDWAYTTVGTKTISVRVTTDAPATETETFSLIVISESDDNLFSSDNDLFPYEPNLYRFLPLGKSSFKYAHRAAQQKILAYLDEQKIWKNDSTRFTAEDIIDIHEFKYWSIFQTLLIIFESNQLSVGDLFQDKREEYERNLIQARNRAALRLDKDGDGVVETGSEIYSLKTARLYRR